LLSIKFNITDKMRRRRLRMLLQIDAAVADYEAEQQKPGTATACTRLTRALTAEGRL
jgi:hypothetical protein